MALTWPLYKIQRKTEKGRWSHVVLVREMSACLHGIRAMLAGTTSPPLSPPLRPPLAEQHRSSSAKSPSFPFLALRFRDDRQTRRSFRIRANIAKCDTTYMRADRPDQHVV